VYPFLNVLLIDVVDQFNAVAVATNGDASGDTVAT
jgi:hypothetical protein